MKKNRERVEVSGIIGKIMLFDHGLSKCHQIVEEKEASKKSV